MSIYDAIADGASRTPNIAQAVMQGQQTRIQRDMAPLEQQRMQQQLALGEQQLEVGNIQLEAARNPQMDPNEMLEAETSRATLAYNTLSMLDGVPEERRSEVYSNVVYPLMSRLYEGEDIPQEYDPEAVGTMSTRFGAYVPALTDYRKAMRDAADMRRQGLVNEAEALETAARADLERRSNPERTPPNLQRITALVEGEERPSSLSYDPADGRHFRVVDGQRQYLNPDQFTPVNQTVTGSREEVLPPTRADTIQGNLDWTEFGMSTIDDMLGKIMADPSIVGPAGTFRRVVRTGTGVITDIAELLGRTGAADARQYVLEARDAARRDLQNGRMDEEAFNEVFGNPALDELPLFENALTYMLARTWNPEDRLHAQTLRDAKDNVRLTGLTSSEQAVNRLNYVRGQLEARRDSLLERLGQVQQQDTDNDPLGIR